MPVVLNKHNILYENIEKYLLINLDAKSIFKIEHWELNL